MHKKEKKCQVTRRKELFYYVTSGSNVTLDVHLCVTVDYQQIANDNIANQIHGLTIDYGKFILIQFSHAFALDTKQQGQDLRSLQINHTSFLALFRCWFDS